MSAVSVSHAARPSPPSQLRRNALMLGLMALLIWAAVGIDVDLEKLLKLPSGVWSIVYRMFVDPGLDWSYLPTALQAMVQSIQIAWVGTIIGAFISLPIGFLAAKNVSGGLLSNALRIESP